MWSVYIGYVKKYHADIYNKVKVRVHRYVNGQLAIFHGPRKLAEYDNKGNLKRELWFYLIFIVFFLSQQRLIKNHTFISPVEFF
jgi:hypothetical protein